MGRRVAVIGAGMTRFVRRAQETGKELAWEASRAAPGLVRAEALRRRRGLPHLCAGRVRRRAHEGGVPLGRCGGVRQAVHAHVRRRRQRGVHGDPGVVLGGERDVRRRALGGRGEDVLDAAAPAGRVPHDLRQHPRTATRAEPAVDLRARDEPLHERVRPRQAGHRRRGGEEQAQRGRSSRRAPRAGRHHHRGRARVRDARVAGAAPRRLADQRRGRGARHRLRGRRETSTDRPVWIEGVGWNLDTAYWTNRDLVFPEYVQNAARMAYEMAGVTEPRKQIHVAEPYDPFDYKELHHLEGLHAVRQGQGSRGRSRRRPQPRRRPAVVSVAVGCSGSGTRSRRRGS